MKKNRVIELDPRERILEKAKKYVESLELFSEEADQAIPVLLKALKYADRDLKQTIMFVLGSFAKEESVWPLYDVMTNRSENEAVRHDAAVQLSVIGAFLKDPQPLRGTSISCGSGVGRGALTLGALKVPDTFRETTG